tara:strand:- start:26946 stop:27866 length:921 start_codon:yes stop_codon:yes gene_type:complete
VALLWAVSPLMADLEVATLHPFIGEIAREVGGDHVVVYELIGPEDNPHEFDPDPRTFALAAEVDLVMASGKGIEDSYLQKLEDNFGEDKIFSVGDCVYSLEIQENGRFNSSAGPNGEHGHEEHDHSHGNDEEAIDPHWWHDPDNMRRAGFAVAKEMARIDPANAASYQSNAIAYAKEMRQLKMWVREELEQIPPSERVLATSHLAYSYFCNAFGFEAIAIQGYNREDTASPQELAELIVFLQNENVEVLFPESGSNPKALETVAQETGLRIGQPLNPDGNGLSPSSGYADMMRSNVSAIVEGLTQE